MKPRYILSIDQGTTSSRAILFDHRGQPAGQAKKEFRQFYPRPGWVEHDPLEIWSSQASVVSELLAQKGVRAEDIFAVGITNQRETTLVWDRLTGIPLYNAIVWQDRRTASLCDALKKDGHEEWIREKTGLILDAYFSATKIKWILDQVPGARKKAEKGRLCFGTVDSWLLWKLTGGSGRSGVHATDISNASRTLLFNIHALKWDPDLLKLFEIPESILPEVKSCSEVYGHTRPEVLGFKAPVSGMAGDQQAALFGQLCVEEGMVKNTYGTGCFMILNTGPAPIRSENRLLTTIAWKIGDRIAYGLEGSVFIAGAVIQWLRDGIQILEDASSSEALAASAKDNDGVYFVPALSGLGAPHWDPYARGTITGITRGTTRAHIVRAALESIAFQVRDVLTAMEKDYGKPLAELRVDGGASVNNLLLQFQSDITGIKAVRPKVMETTALGAAYLAGLSTGFWNDLEALKRQWAPDRVFKPKMEAQKANRLLSNWNKALERSKGWIEPDLSAGGSG